MLPPNISRNMNFNMFLLLGFLSACSASYKPDLSPLYPFNGGNSFDPTPFAPPNDQAWINMMWWKSLAGKPVESLPGLVDPYDEDVDSINQFLLWALKEGNIPGITPGAYQKWTQFSNPAADYIGYGLFSNPLGHKAKLPPLGSTLFQPGNDMFWLMQYLQAQDRNPGDKITNDLLKQYNYLLNSQAPLSVDPYANYWAFKNSYPQRKRRSVDDEDDEDDEENVIVEAMVKASVKEDEDAVAEVAAQDAAEEEESNTDDMYPDILRGQRSEEGDVVVDHRNWYENTFLPRSYETDPTHEEEDEVVVDYSDWYENTYLPWYEKWDKQMNEYKLQMMMYEAAQYKKFVPKNPFGDVSFGNPFPFYSKTAYKQSLFDDVNGVADPSVTYKTEYDAYL